MNLKFKFEVQSAVRSWAALFMEENKVPASLMVDALNSVLLELKDMSYLEMIREVEQNQVKEIEEQ